MLNINERNKLADLLQPQTELTALPQPIKPNLKAFLFWVALVVITPLAVPLMALYTELTKPFKKQRY